MNPDSYNYSASNPYKDAAVSPSTSYHPLYSLKRILSIEPRPASPVRIQTIAMGGYQGNSCIAIVCSNEYIIFRCVGEAGVPLIRHFKWFKSPTKRIVVMAFDPTAQWLMCVTGDSTILLLPIYFLMQRKGNATIAAESYDRARKGMQSSTRIKGLSGKATGWGGNWFNKGGSSSNGGSSNGKHSRSGGGTDHLGSFDGITFIDCARKQKPSPLSACVWWKRFNGGGDYAILSSRSGTLVFIDLAARKKVHTIRMRWAIEDIQLVSDPMRRYQYVLLHTKGGGYFYLLLEKKLKYGDYAHILKVPLATGDRGRQDDAFNPTFLKRFSSKGRYLSVQHTHQGPQIGVYNSSTHKFELYDPSLPKFALYVYQLSPGTRRIHVTGKLIFAVTTHHHHGKSSSPKPLSSATTTTAAATNATTSPSALPTTTARTGADGAPASGIAAMDGGTRSHSPASAASGASRVAVVSKVMAESSLDDNHAWVLKRQTAVMQEFVLPRGERVRGSFGPVPPGPTGGGGGGGGGSLASALGPSASSSSATSSSSSSSSPPGGISQRHPMMTTMMMGGMFVWTDNAVYECVPNVAPEDIFYRLLGQGLGSPTCSREQLLALVEPLGKTMGLDLLHLYECAADACYARHEYQHAMKLYELSDASSTKLLSKMLQEGEVTPAIPLLASKLSPGPGGGRASVPVGERTWLANTLLKCYLTRVLATDAAAPEASKHHSDFHAFLTTNPDYHAQSALRLLHSHGLYSAFFKVGRVRNATAALLDILQAAGDFHLGVRLLGESQEVRAHIKTAKRLPLFRALPPAFQLRLLLEHPEAEPAHRHAKHPSSAAGANHILSPRRRQHHQKQHQTPAPSPVHLQSHPRHIDSEKSHHQLAPPGIVTYFQRLEELLPRVDEQCLIDLAIALDPRAGMDGVVMARTGAAPDGRIQRAAPLSGIGKESSSSSSSSSEASPQAPLPQEPPSEGPTCAEEYYELYLTVLLVLHHRKRTHTFPPAPDYTLLSSAFFGGSVEAAMVAAATTARSSETALSSTSPRSTSSSSSSSSTMVGDGDPPQRRYLKGAYVACGWSHMVAVSRDTRNVYAWGRNSSGELGLGIRSSMELLPRRVLPLKGRPVELVACGGDHTVALLNNGAVWGWGRGDMGQLGVVYKGADGAHLQPQPMEGLEGYRIVQVACGYAHTIVVASTGEALGCGSNDHGQLGVGDTKGREVPCRLPCPTHITHASCGWCHTALLSDAGDVYTCGSNIYGQLGHRTAPHHQDQMEPAMVDALHEKRIRHIGCGAFHTVALTDLDSLYVWGGTPSTTATATTSVQSKAHDGKPSASRHHHRGHAGHRHAFHHGGGGGGGGFGSMDGTTPRMPPRLVKGFARGQSIVRVACGHSHTVVVTTREVYVLHMKEANGAGAKRVDALDGSLVENVGAGEDTSCVLMKDGLVLTWGEGAMGSLGHGHEDTLDRPHPVAMEDGASARAKRRYHFSSSSGQHVPLLGQTLLERLLAKETGLYRPVIMAEKCLRWENYRAAAVVYKAQGQWNKWLHCCLKAISLGQGMPVADRPRKGGARPEALKAPPSSNETSDPAEQASKPTHAAQERHTEQMGLTLDLVVAVMRHAMPEDEKSQCFLLILKFWKSHGYEPRKAEQSLSKHLSDVASPLVALMQSRIEKHPKIPLVLPFSTEFYMAITLSHVSQAGETHTSRGTSPESSNIKWNELKTNLPKDIDKRPRIVIPHISLWHDSSPSANGGRGAGAEGVRGARSRASDASQMIFFTCNERHHYSRGDFFEILEQFRERVAAFPSPIPTTLSLMMEEYRQKKISLACPVCLYGVLRLEQLSLHPEKEYELQVWKPKGL